MGKITAQWQIKLRLVTNVTQASQNGVTLMSHETGDSRRPAQEWSRAGGSHAEMPGFRKN